MSGTPAVPRRYGSVDDPAAFVDRPRSVTVCVPVLNDPVGIARTAVALLPLVAEGAIDRLLVLDGGSTDGTAEAATQLGCEVARVSSLAAGAGPVMGKGDSMWRANELLDTDVVVFVDADLENISPRMPLSLAAPLVFGEEVDFAKGLFHRVTDRHDPREYDGGRVTELVARPLLNLLCPELAVFYQPLGGQIGIRRELFASLPIFTGYGIEIGMLLDVARRIGLERIGEVELGDLVNSDKADGALLPMAQQVAYTLLSRTGRSGTGLSRAGLPGTDEAGLAWRPAQRPRFDGTMAALDASPMVQRPPWNEFTART